MDDSTRAGQPAAPPPASNTGVEMRSRASERPTLSLSWYQGTTRATDPTWLLLWLGARFGAVEVLPYGTRWYEHRAQVGSLGVYVAWGPRDRAGTDEALVVVPQSACDALGWDGCLELVRAMRGMGVRESRVDLAWDDFARTVDPETVKGALDRGDKRSHVREWSWTGKHSDGGYTLGIGDRSSEVYCRVYRKWAERRDASYGVRWEGEFHGPRAVAALSLVVAASDPGETFWGLLRSFCEFVDRAGHVRGDEAPLTTWWAALIASAPRVRLASSVVVSSLASRERWLYRQASASLAALFARDGSEALDGLIRSGWARGLALLAAEGFLEGQGSAPVDRMAS